MNGTAGDRAAPAPALGQSGPDGPALGVRALGLTADTALGSAGRIGRSPENDAVYRAIRSEIQYEFSLISARINWLITSQAFLFVPLVIGTPHGEGPDTVAASVLFPFIPILGLALCAIVLLGTVAAALRIGAWRAKYAGTDYAGHGEHGRFSIVQPRAPWIHRLGLAASLGVPVVLAAAWAIVLIWPPHGSS